MAHLQKFKNNVAHVCSSKNLMKSIWPVTILEEVIESQSKL